MLLNENNRSHFVDFIYSFSRWNAPLRWRENVKTSDIEFYRNELDIQMESQVLLHYPILLF